MTNPISRLHKGEKMLWGLSLLVVLCSNIATGKINLLNLISTLIGVTALIFLAKGDVFGQILSAVFSVLYAVTAYTFRYWGEMITYAGMTLPMAILATVSWIHNPSAEKNVVQIQKLKAHQIVLTVLLTAGVTQLFYYVLKYLETPNLVVSTVSVATSFSAVFLTFLRSPYYALCYSLNDVVLIVLWILASIEDFSYFPMIVCFAMFLVNDLYGFVSWRKRQTVQSPRA